MAFEWIDSLLGNKQNKEAQIIPQGTDKEDHFERKIAASNWIADVAELDEKQIEKEFLAAQAAEARALGKTAAHEFKSDEEVLKADMEKAVKILSDYALAELLAEVKGNKEQNTAEMFAEHKEAAKKQVASSREKAEKALLDSIPENAQLDWKKEFARYSKESKPEEVKEKDLYKPVFKEEKQNWEGKESKDKDFVITDKEKADVGAGNGREADERQEVTKEPGELQEKKASLDKVAEVSPSGLKNKLVEMGYSEESANAISGQWQSGQKVGTEPKTTQDVEKALAELSKTAEWPMKPGDKPTLYDELNKSPLKREEVCPVCGSEEQQELTHPILTPKELPIKSDLETEGIPSAQEIAESFINGNISWVKEQIAGNTGKLLDVLSILESWNPDSVNSFKKVMRNASLDKQAEGCPVCGAPGRDLANGQKESMSCEACGVTYANTVPEIQSHASKTDVIKKIAEISSPWVVQTLDDGTQVIARVEQENKNIKESEEDLTEELKK